MIRDWKDATLQRFLKEGRGQGIGESYRPWLQVQDLPSKGRVSRVFSYKENRVIHLLSDLQLYYYYLLEFDDSVSFREQYPLLDLHELNLPIDQGLTKKLFDSKTGVPHVFITTFLITRTSSDGSSVREARMVKTSSELGKKATLARLEIQRRYYKAKNIDFGLVTEHQINRQLARNIEWVLTARELEDYPDLSANFHEFRHGLIDQFCSAPGSFQQAFARFEKEHGLDEGMGLVMFKHLLATKQIKMLLDQKIDLKQGTSMYNLQIPAELLRGESHAAGS